MTRPNIRFDQELNRGVVSYNGKLGRWWQRQASNTVHKYAYRNIANYIRASSSGAACHIVDYACGSGELLSRLLPRFPDARLMGIDGSPMLLDLARKRLESRRRQRARRVTLVESRLPNFDLPRGFADMVVFAFPNIVPSSDEGEAMAHAHLHAEDLDAARDLALAYHNHYKNEVPDVLYADLLRDRMVSLNIRRLLKRGGLCVRVEYGNASREELPQVELQRTELEEGSMEHPVNSKRTAQWFRVIASSYFRSRVMEDVYHQSGDIRDKNGGYFITVLRAI